MAENETTQPQTRLSLSLPGSGNTKIYKVTSDMLVAFDFDVTQAVFSGNGNHLVISVEGQGSIVIEDYLLMAEQDALPMFELLGGELIPGGVYLFAFSAAEDQNELETAADGSSGSRGAGAYSAAAGPLFRGIASLPGQ
ncbi:MAG: hypothetical protein KKD85_02925, partial [Proteobacteria bacterium]|nr:hypothetical protein [Pseudomonadota bacterium]